MQSHRCVRALLIWKGWGCTCLSWQFGDMELEIWSVPSHGSKSGALCSAHGAKLWGSCAGYWKPATALTLMTLCLCQLIIKMLTLIIYVFSGLCKFTKARPCYSILKPSQSLNIVAAVTVLTLIPSSPSFWSICLRWYFRTGLVERILPRVHKIVLRSLSWPTTLCPIEVQVMETLRTHLEPEHIVRRMHWNSNLKMIVELRNFLPAVMIHTMYHQSPSCESIDDD